MENNLVESITSSSKRVGDGFNDRSGFSKSVLSGSYSHFDRSSIPLRFMYFCNDRWCNFSNDVVRTLRTGFLERRPIIEASIDGAKYIFDLKRLLQIEYSTGNFRSISWIDESFKCFFPSEFLDCVDCDDDISCNCKNKNNNCNPKIEIVAKIDRNRSKRKREEAEVSSSYKVPAVGNGSIIKEAAIFSNTQRLREKERDWYLIRDHFVKGTLKVAPLVTVTSIHKCKWESQLDKTRIDAFHKQNEIIRAARGNSNVVYAWFGASAKLVERILVHGFGLPTKQLPETDAYGVGVYLSSIKLPLVSAKLADADDNGLKHLILCRVILGNVEKVEAGSEQHLPSSVKFDTGSDDPKNPKWYVIWPNIASLHILPEAVVSFRHSIHMPGPPRRLLGGTFSLETLILKIKNHLPPVKVRELSTTYSTYKAEMMSKVVFIRKLRDIVGDEVIRYAVLEINASG